MRFLSDFLLASNKQGHGGGGTWPAKHAKIREKNLNQDQTQGAKPEREAGAEDNF
jgi:hypothetical protein